MPSGGGITGTGGREPRQGSGAVLAALVVAALGYALGAPLAAPALPTIQRELSASLEAVTFVVTAFLVVGAIATPVAGRLGDMFGKRRVLLAALWAFAGGSLIAAATDSIEVLIAGRAIQGVAGGALPLAFGIVRDQFPPRRVPLGLGLISATLAIGGSTSLVLSGLIVEVLGYRWIFWLSLANAAAAIVCTHLFVPVSRASHPTRIDWAGAGLLAAGLATLLVAISEAGSLGPARVAGLLCAAVALLVAWTGQERRAPEPLVDLRMLRERTVLVTNLVGLLAGFGMFSSYILVPRFVQAPAHADYGFGASPTEAGLYLLPFAAAIAATTPLGGLLSGRYGSKLPLLLGTAFSCTAFVVLATGIHDQRWPIYAATAVLGGGMGLTLTAMPNLIVEAVQRSQTGVATGMNVLLRSIGGSIGGQVAAGILAFQQTAVKPLPAESAYTIAFVATATALAAAFLLALALARRR